MSAWLFSKSLLIFILSLSSPFSEIAADNQPYVPTESRKYRFHADPKIKHADGEPGEAWISIVPNADGFFALKGSVAYYREDAMDFAGGGVLESDGLIHFSWENILGKGGKGTLRFAEDGKKVILLLGAAENNQAWSLIWTGESMASSLATALRFRLLTPREYEFTTTEGKYEISTGVVIYPAKDGTFEIGGHLYRTPGKAIDFDGTGKLEKDGLIHFSWEDSFKKKGNGTLRFIEGGKRIALMMGLTRYEWILTWTENPVELDVRTQPSGYLVHLPAEYECNGYKILHDAVHIFFILKPLKGNAVYISAVISSSGQECASISGQGTWESGDIVSFSFTDDGKQQGKGHGQLHFLSANQTVFTFTYSSPISPETKKFLTALNATPPTLNLKKSD